MFKSSFIVMGINMLSRLLGLAREMLMAFYFGSSGYTDAYFASTRIANFFTTMLGEGSLGTVFIPLYKEKMEKDGLEKANNFIFSVTNLIINFTLIIAFITFFFSKPILKYLIGFNDNKRFIIANNLLKIMAFYVVFIALSGIAASVLNNYKKFYISTLTGVIFNITIIAGIFISNKTIGIYGLGISFLLSGFFQMFIQLPSFFMIVKKYKFLINLKDPYVKEFFLLMIPTLIGIFAYQINEIVDTNFAAYLKVGTISAINYASRLYLLPVGIFAVSLSVVIFPNLSSAVVKNDKEIEKLLFTRGLNLLCFLIIPSIFGLFFYSEQIVKLLFGYGKFDKNSIILTSEILKCYSLGLLFFSTNHLLTREHYVHKNRYTPVIASFISIAINIFLDYMLYKKYAHVGITLATSISAMFNYIILFISIKRKYINFNILKYAFFLLKTIVISIICLLISNNFNNIIIKLIIYILSYFVLWSYEIIRKRINMFD